jgi:hypothetical protein
MTSYQIAFGALADDIEDQLKPQGLTLGSRASMIHRAAENISYLAIHGLLTDSEKDRARKRLMKEIKAAVKPITGDNQ